MTLTPAGRGLAVAAAAVLLLSACTSGDDGGDDGGSGSSSDDWTPGPLDEYMAKAMGYSFGDDQPSQSEQQAEMDRNDREVERLVTACMSEQGFDYKPRTGSSTFVTGDELDVDWGSLEFAETYGFGVTTDPWGSTDVDEGDSDPDPNQAYVDAMSDTEREAYQEALWGPSTEVDPSADGEQEYDWRSGGCYGAAQHEVYESGAFAEDSPFRGLQDEISALWETVQSSSEMTALDADWASCMADAGFADQTIRNEASQSVWEQYDELQGGEEQQALYDSWDWDAEPDGPPAPEADEGAVERLRKDEIALAVADWRCADKLGYDDRAMTISHAHQQTFVDQHEAELEAWVEAATEARS